MPVGRIRGAGGVGLMTQVCFIIAGVLLLAVLHPFVIYPVSLLAVRYWYGSLEIRARTLAGHETLAVCLCAYNEERVVEGTVLNLLTIQRELPDLQILVYVDAATDRTAELLYPYAERITLCISQERRGKTHGMNTLVAMSKASIIVFIDANVTLDQHALKNVNRYFEDPSVGCVCGHLVYVNPGESVTAGTGSLYWRLEEWVKQLETDTGSAMGADGSLFAIRRSLHRSVPEDILDDMFLSLSILCDGSRVVRAADVKAYERSVTSAAEEFRRKIRIGCIAFNVHRLLWPRLRKLGPLVTYKYVSHKLLRWFAIYNLLLSVLFLEAGLAMGHEIDLAFGLPVLAAALLFIGRNFRVKPLAEVWDVLCAFVATGIGIWLSLRGERFQTWTPATSNRK
jgi:cellulose synthase/poly-beta-1,6-N-acetylglucosamine synthase-like glycosyltransferase